jgi:uncharacterized protein YjbJ (UPF0337 family)
VTKGSGAAFVFLMMTQKKPDHDYYAWNAQHPRDKIPHLCSPRSTIQHFNSLSCSVFQMQVSRAWMHEQTTKGDQMKDSTKDQIQGKVHEAKGKIKEKAGILTNNPNLQAEGQDEKLGGKIQKKIGQVEKVFEK